MLDSLAQYIYGSALGNFPLQAGQEPSSCLTVLVQVQRGCRFGLGVAQEGG